MVKKILMVCLGNICRSPIAQAVMNATLRRHHACQDWEVDSAAIANWHVGKEPNIRAKNVMKKYKLPYKNRARQIKVSDFYKFDYIFVMDLYNVAELNVCTPQNATAKLLLLSDFVLPEAERVVEDPYSIPSDDSFEKFYQQCVVACEEFLKRALNHEI